MILADYFFYRIYQMGDIGNNTPYDDQELKIRASMILAVLELFIVWTIYNFLEYKFHIYLKFLHRNPDIAGWIPGVVMICFYVINRIGYGGNVPQELYKRWGNETKEQKIGRTIIMIIVCIVIVILFAVVDTRKRKYGLY